MEIMVKEESTGGDEQEPEHTKKLFSYLLFQIVMHGVGGGDRMNCSDVEAVDLARLTLDNRRKKYSLSHLRLICEQWK